MMHPLQTGRRTDRHTTARTKNRTGIFDSPIKNFRDVLRVRTEIASAEIFLRLCHGFALSCI